MPTTTIAPPLTFRGFDNNGQPLAFGQLFTYAAGTSTKIATYVDSTGTQPNTNPIILNIRGECDLWLDQTKSYKFVLAFSTDSDPPVNPIKTTDNVPGGFAPAGLVANLVPTPPNTLTLGTPAASWANIFLGPLNAAAFDPVTGNILSYGRTPQELAAAVVPVNLTYPPGHLYRYGTNTIPGVTDMTAAANLATMAIVPYSTFPLLTDIIFPPGQILISGTVYVRKGQRLHGSDGGTYIVANNSGAGPTFKLGWGLIGGVPTLDSGGQPVSLGNLFTVGGPALGCIDVTSVAGAFLYDLFLSSPALGITGTSSSDVNLNNVIIDQGLTGISLTGCGNWQGSLIKFFNVNTDFAVGSNCYDCQFSNGHSEFNNLSSVLFADSATGIYNMRFTDWTFTYNAQAPGSYTGAIQNRAVAPGAKFIGCSFNNMPGYAYLHGTGTGGLIEFENCTFDGLATRTLAPAYAQSTTAGAISMANETVICRGCEFKNLLVSPILMAGAAVATTLEMEGCKWFGNNASFSLVNITATSGSFRASGCKGDATQSLLNAQSAVAVSVRNCQDWFGVIATSGASHFVTVPYQFANVYQVTLKANTAPGGGAQYRNCTVTNVVKSNDFAAGPVLTSYLTTNIPIQGAAHGNIVAATVVEFGAVGGGVTTASANSGIIAISWPSAYANESIDVQMVI